MTLTYFPLSYVLSVTELTLWVALKCSAVGIGFNGAETNCGIGHILGILLMNSYNTDICFSNYYNLQSVHFELCVVPAWNLRDIRITAINRC